MDKSKKPRARAAKPGEQATAHLAGRYLKPGTVVTWEVLPPAPGSGATSPTPKNPPDNARPYTPFPRGNENLTRKGIGLTPKQLSFLDAQGIAHGPGYVDARGMMDLYATIPPEKREHLEFNGPPRLDYIIDAAIGNKATRTGPAPRDGERRSPPMSLAQFGLATRKDYRTFRDCAAKHWGLGDETDGRYTVDLALMDPGTARAIEDHANGVTAKLRASRKKHSR